MNLLVVLLLVLQFCNILLRSCVKQPSATMKSTNSENKFPFKDVSGGARWDTSSVAVTVSTTIEMGIPEVFSSCIEIRNYCDREHH